MGQMDLRGLPLISPPVQMEHYRFNDTEFESRVDYCLLG